MITNPKTLSAEELTTVTNIWLEGNTKAHDFIPTSYWLNNYDLVKSMLAQANLYLQTIDQQIVGFAGLNDSYIAGIFIKDHYQRQGLGHDLLIHLKTQFSQLTLSVYAKNQKAYHFYLKQEFQVIETKIDEATGEKELEMHWGCLINISQ